MNKLYTKIKEVVRTLLPVLILVLLISFTLIKVEADVIWRFLVCSVLLLLGLSIFLWGVDLAMNPIGEKMSLEVATSKTPLKIAFLSFLLGFLITVAEPDLLILGHQVQSASGGTLKSMVIVYLVSVGVGIMISLGVFRLLRKKKMSIFMAITYGIILILSFFVSEEFLAISFDASGATTGALTTPFVLALSLGLSRIKGGKDSEEDSFGLVGIMSAGPILALMLMSIISGQKHIQGEAAQFVISKGIFGPIFNTIPSVLLESLIAVLPISILFFIFNFKKFKIPKTEIFQVLKGLLLIIIGLTFFLTAANSGFMDMGRIIGMGIAEKGSWILILIAFLLGLIIVLVEPAVHVLGEQIEEVTSGHISRNIIWLTLSIGVGIAIALSMLRIVVPSVKLWYFLLPGFAIAILLSFKVDPIFVGIAYDAGGVASGPMTATFILAFAQGAATIVPTANVLVDGFGVIAMVAMAPVLSIMILGTIFKLKKTAISVAKVTAKKELQYANLTDNTAILHYCIFATVSRGFSEKVVSVARSAGAIGATIINARGSDMNHTLIQPEKEIVMLVTDAKVSESVASSLLSNEELNKEAVITVFLSPADAMLATFKTGSLNETTVSTSE